jgi:hypothetical protein
MTRTMTRPGHSPRPPAAYRPTVALLHAIGQYEVAWGRLHRLDATAAYGRRKQVERQHIRARSELRGLLLELEPGTALTVNGVRYAVDPRTGGIDREELRPRWLRGGLSR